MKFYLLSLISLISVSFSAQTKMSSETKQYFKKIETTFANQDISQDKIATEFPNLPIYKVNGEFCISTVAKVDANFKKEAIKDNYLTTHIGEVITLKIPLRNISENIDFENVTILKIAERIQPDIHKMIVDTRSDSVWQGINLPQGYTGKNVLIGITDWGFDYEHPMFMDTTLSQTRIRAAWDHFKIVGNQPSGMNYGVEYTTPSELMAAKSDTAGTYYDYATHGNHVAGIAGGSGAGLQYRGVAFEAEYLFNSIQLDEGAAIDAFNWMKSIADADGKRLVINMSWGLYYMGTMDGTSLISNVINTLSDAGVVFVTSAGNNGNVNFHIKKEFNNDSIRSRVTFYGYNQHPQMWGQCISIWGQPSMPFGTRLEIYNSSNVLVGSSNVYKTDLDNGYHDTIMVLGTDTIFYNLTIDEIHPLNNRPHIRLRVKNTNTNSKVVLSSFAPTGTVHYWNVVELSNGVGNWGLALAAFGNGGVSGNSDYSIGEPACTESAISVAAHVSENYSQSGVAFPGNRASFSSKGPTYDERMKPDVSAPGSGIVSSINSYTTNSFNSVANVSFNGRTYHFASFSGTSMSSPATAGVVALILEANPQLSAEQVKDIIKNTARQDNVTGIITSPGSTLWGMGKVTATSAIEMALNTVSVNIKEEKGSILLFPNPANDFVSIYKDFEGTLDYQVFNLQGSLISEGKLNDTETIYISDWAEGLYFIQIQTPERNVTLKFVKI